MNFDKEVARTWNSNLSDRDKLANAALGLVGEAGEVSEHIKKHLYHGKDLDHNKVLHEVGDVLYYVQALLSSLDSSYTIDQCMELVIHKLRVRHPNGFSGNYNSKEEVNEIKQG